MPEQSWRSHLKENDGGVLPVKFDVAKLKANLSLLPSGYELKKIDLATVCCSALISFCRKAYSLKTRF